MGYLGFWVTRDGVKPIDRKIEAITFQCGGACGVAALGGSDGGGHDRAGK